MKLLLISHTNNIQSGAGNLTHELCMFLKGKVDFTLLLPKGEKKYDYTSYSVQYVLPEYIFDMKTPKVVEYLFFNYKTDADLIHSIFEFPTALIAHTIARKNKKPLLIGLAGTYAVKPLLFFPDSFFLKRAYNYAKNMTAISSFTADMVKKYSQTKTSIEIIHCPVNFERFSKEVNVTELKNKYNGKKILLTVGALKPRKGHDIVIRALALLRQKRSDFQYIIIGNNEERSVYMDNLENLITTNNLGDYVTFAGSISDEDLPMYYQAATAYVHTPVVVNWNFEGFGIVYLEAGAAGKPVIASNSGGVNDAVVNDKTGIVVSEGDIQETYRAIKRILDDEPLARRLGNGGYEYAREHTWEKIGQKFLDLYKKCIVE